MYDLIIIGGGAAGIMAAAHSKGLRTLLIEGEKELMQKLEISGSGRCNLTHSGDMNEFLNKYGKGKEKFVRKALMNFKNEDTVNFFEAKGVETIILENDKIFPKADTAKVLSRVLLESAKSANVEILTSRKVVNIVRNDETGVFQVEIQDGAQYLSQNVLIATGGKSYFKTGSDGSGYKLASLLGHTIERPRVALSPIFIDDKQHPNIGDIAGTAFENIEIQMANGISFKGKMVITHKGLSGPVILDSSRYFSEGDEIKVNFSKDLLTCKELEKVIIEVANTNGKQKVSTFLRNISATSRLGDYIYAFAKIEKDYELAILPKFERIKIVEALTRCPFLIKRLGGFEVAMATAGGVIVREVKAGTMESKLVKGLYFAGEVLDIDGDTGGYNIQWAFSSGVMAVKSIK